MKKLVLPMAVVAALVVMGSAANSADAQSFRISIGAPVVHVGHGYGYSRFGHTGFRRAAFYGGGGAVWHDTSHYDHYPATYQRHGNHYDYVPAHTHFHQDGHWDVHRW
jgi:hypothetical protein